MGEQVGCNGCLVSTFLEDNRRWLDSWTLWGACRDVGGGTLRQGTGVLGGLSPNLNLPICDMGSLDP